MLSAASLAQTTVPAASPVHAPGLPCNGTQIFDPFKGRLAGPDLPPGLLPIDTASRDKALKSGLPCQENVRPKLRKGIRLEMRLAGWKTCSAASTFIRGALSSR